uniref:E3 ubiquitin-protein ligase n=1 Tax=Xenopus tropicalis TaxID=8364 RepID=A0A6I8T253_XENTR
MLCVAGAVGLLLGDVNKCDASKISLCQAEDCTVKMCVSQPKGVNTKANFQVQQWLNKVKTDESQKLQCLAELIQWLKERTVKFLESFPVQSVVVVLVKLLEMDHNFDIMNFTSFAILEILSHTHGRAILLTGELGDCFYDLECFSIQAKRNALAVAAKCCQEIQPSEFHLIAKALPELSQRLTHQDKESLESILESLKPSQIYC